MTTLIRTENGRCDARCYNGKPETKCKCCCGGRNHAVGLEAAVGNNRELFGMDRIIGKLPDPNMGGPKE